jgi:hypothetical protein
MVCVALLILNQQQDRGEEEKEKGNSSGDTAGIPL